jgi:hypothetical protein
MTPILVVAQLAAPHLIHRSELVGARHAVPASSLCLLCSAPVLVQPSALRIALPAGIPVGTHRAALCATLRLCVIFSLLCLSTDHKATHDL